MCQSENQDVVENMNTANHDGKSNKSHQSPKPPTCSHHSHGTLTFRHALLIFYPDTLLVSLTASLDKAQRLLSSTSYRAGKGQHYFDLGTTHW